MSAAFLLDTRPFGEETRIIAEKELNETPERVASATAELKQLLQEATDLHYYDDDEFLLTFLRPCHFYPKSALDLVSKKKSLCLFFLFIALMGLVSFIFSCEFFIQLRQLIICLSVVR